MTIDLNQINWSDLGNQLIGVLQPILSKLGDLIGSLAGGAAQVVATIFFSLILSYLLTIETGGAREKILFLISQDIKTTWKEWGKRSP